MIVHCVLFPLVLISLYQCHHIDLWKSHKQRHNLEFTESEEKFRFEVFTKNCDFIDQMNKLNLGYTLEANKFAHWTDEEYSNFLMTPMSPSISGDVQMLPEDDDKDDQEEFDDDDDDGYSEGGFFIKSVDWRKKGGVTPVKDQGSCGSCWAFSAVGTLESALLIQKSINHSLSEQQVVDCSKFNHGCNGGWPNRAFEYMSSKGIELSKDYEYTARDMDCDYDRYSTVVKPSGYVKLPKSEKNLTTAIKNIGPISVCINASGDGFRFYKSGIYYDPKCSDRLNHAVVAVGYGKTRKGSYYIVKNSWGTDWGDAGYIKMARNKNNHCGIASEAAYPIL